MANSKLVTVDVLAYNNEKIKEQLDKKINIQQNVADANKILGINENGIVTPIEAPSSVKVSAESDNQIEQKTDGIYVKDMSAKISAEQDNALIEKQDGLYVPSVSETKVSGAEGNTIEVKDDGIYVAPTDLDDYSTTDEVKELIKDELYTENTISAHYEIADSTTPNALEVVVDGTATDGQIDLSNVADIGANVGDFVVFVDEVTTTDTKYAEKTSVYSKSETDEKIAEAVTGGTVDLSSYVKTETLTEELAKYTNTVDSDEKYVLDEEIKVLSESDVLALLNMSDEELANLSNMFLDTEVRLDRGWSSSAIYTKLQENLDLAKTYTLEEIAKAAKASYKVVSSTSDVIETSYIYLIENGTTFDMYILDTDTSSAVQIGTTEIDLSGFYTKTESEDLFATKADLVANYATKQEVVDGYATKEELSDLQDAVDNATVEVSQESDNILEQKDDGLYVGKIDITTTLTEDTVSDTSVPSSKAVYDELQNVSTGNSAYEIAKKNGFEGTEEEWLKSLKGEKGDEGRSIKAITKDNNNNIIVTFSDNTTENIGELSVDIQGDFLAENGFGNLRYYEGKFQYYDTVTSAWIDTSVSPENVYIMQMMPQTMESFDGLYDIDLGKNKLRWKEPKDTIIDGQVCCIVEKVVIRRKLGSTPLNETDGDLVIEVGRSEFGSYTTAYFVDEGLTPTSNEVWYYKAFPISTTGFCNSSSINEKSILCKDYHLYGFKLDQNESDPSSMITYLSDCDNSGYKSAYMDYTTGLFNYGDWANAWFMNVKPCMLNYDGTVAYYLNLDDYTLKEDGTASDIANDAFGGNAMVGIPKVYWKIVDNGDNTANIYFSDKKVDEDFVCWSHIDNDGNEIDYCYMPIYNGSNVSNQLRSLSGKTPIYSQTGTTEITYALANNQTDDTIWYTEVFSDRMLINLLLLLIGKSTNTQTVFGNGHYTGGSSVSNLLVTGTLNDKGLFYGTNGTGKGVKVFGMEHWWGNQWRRIAGWINNKGTQMIKLTYGQSDGSTIDGYNTDGTGYISIGYTPSGTIGGYISKIAFNENGLIPITVSGSATTYYTDGLWFNNSQVDYALVGGSSDNGLIVGALFSALSDTVSNANWGSGAAVSCKPLATT